MGELEGGRCTPYQGLCFSLNLLYHLEAVKAYKTGSILTVSALQMGHSGGIYRMDWREAEGEMMRTSIPDGHNEVGRGKGIDRGEGMANELLGG